MLIYLFATLVGFCSSCAIHSCLKCENKISDYKSFLNQESFNYMKCFNKNDYSTVLCKSNECLTQIHIMYSSEYETKTLQDLKSHMITIKRGCKINYIKPNCESKEIEKRMFTFCNYLCHGRDCNSKEILDGRENNIRRFVPTCLKCSTLFNKEYSVISNSCNNNKMPGSQELCFGKCYITASFNKHSILFNRGCLNDLNGFTFKSEYGIININGVVVYSLCNSEMYEHCNSNIKIMDLNVENLKSMEKFLGNIEKSKSKQLCLSCKSSRSYKQSETNCEKGLQSSAFNIIDCSDMCYTKVLSDKFKIIIVRGCGNVNETSKGETKNIGRDKYFCNDCFSTCVPRINILCNSKQYIISNESLLNMENYSQNDTKEINLIRIVDAFSIIKPNTPTHYNKMVVNKIYNKMLSNSLHKVKHRTNKVKFMQNKNDLPQLTEDDIMTKISEGVTKNSLETAEQVRFFRLNLELKKGNDKKEFILSQLKELQKKSDSSELKEAIDIRSEFDDEDLKLIFENNDKYSQQQEELISDFENYLNEAKTHIANQMNIYSSHYINSVIASKKKVKDKAVMMISDSQMMLSEINIEKIERSLNQKKFKFIKDMFILYDKFGVKIGLFHKFMLNHQLKFNIKSDYEEKQDEIDKLVTEHMDAIEKNSQKNKNVEEDPFIDDYDMVKPIKESNTISRGILKKSEENIYAEPIIPKFIPERVLQKPKDTIFAKPFISKYTISPSKIRKSGQVNSEPLYQRINKTSNKMNKYLKKDIMKKKQENIYADPKELSKLLLFTGNQKEHIYDKPENINHFLKSYPDIDSKKHNVFLRGRKELAPADWFKKSSKDNVEEIKEIHKDLKEKLNSPNLIYYKQIYGAKIYKIFKELNKMIIDASRVKNDLNVKNYILELKLIHSDVRRLESLDSNEMKKLIQMDPKLIVKEKEYSEQLVRDTKFIDKEIIETVNKLNRANKELEKLGGDITENEKKSNTIKNEDKRTNLMFEIETLETHAVNLGNLKDTKHINVLELNFNLYDEAKKENNLAFSLLNNAYNEKMKSIKEDSNAYNAMKENDKTDELKQVENEELKKKDLNEIYEDIEKHKSYTRIKNSVIETKKAFLLNIKNDISIPPRIRIKPSQEYSTGSVIQRSISRNSFHQVYHNKKLKQAKLYSNTVLNARKKNTLFGSTKISNIRSALKKIAIVGTAVIGLTIGTSGAIVGFEYNRRMATYEPRITITEANAIFFESNDFYNTMINKIEKDEQHFAREISNFNKEDEKTKIKITDTLVKELYNYETMPKIKKGLKKIPENKNQDNKYEVIWLVSGIFVVLLISVIYFKRDSLKC